MANVCETCKNLESYKYWHELPLKEQKFFKIMLGNFEHQLRIPRKFVECFRGVLSSSCTLIGQSGHVWKVQVLKTADDVLFSNGWGNFVKDHDIKIGYFLVFCYAGDSSFEVLVFDPSACEHEGSHFTTNSSSSSKTSCRSLLHFENSMSENATDSENNCMIIEEIAEEEEGSSEVLFKGKRKVDEMTVRKVPKESNFDEGNQVGFKSPKLYKRGGRSQGTQSQKFYLSKRREVSEQEKQRAFNMAVCYISHKSPRDSMFEIIMLPSHVNHGFHLTIPKEWAVKHMLSQSHEVILRVPGLEESWKVGCRWTPSQCQIIRGWSTFVLESNLEEHDVCVFELVQNRELRSKSNPVFHIHIFRVVKEVVPLIVSRSVV